MMMIPDDPMIRSAERTGYGPYDRYDEPRQGWETPDGDFYADEAVDEAVLQMLRDDRSWVLEALGFTRINERYY